MHQVEFLPSLLILLSAAVFLVACFKKLNLSPVLGYFVAGAAIGPHGFNIVNSSETSVIAEFGVVFLLFAIGLELTLERVIAMRKHVFGFGTLQVIVSSLVIGVGYIYTFKYSGINFDINSSIIIGGGLALSSTAIVLQYLTESGRQSTQVGRLSIAILILQDFAVVPLLVLVPLLASPDTDIGLAIANALGKAVIAMILIFIFGRLLLRPIFRIIGSLKSEELFIATTLLVVLGAAFATEHFGLSLALGAFIAGLMVAETEYQHHAEASINPFKGLLLGLFFMTVGMSINVNSMIQNIHWVLGLSVALIVVKTFIMLILFKLFGVNSSTAFNTAILLSQGGEFGFILFGIAEESEIIPVSITQILLLVITTTMALTPLLAVIGKYITDKMEENKPIINEKTKNIMDVSDLDRHIVICGFGRVGQMVARILASERVNYIAIDVDSKRVIEGRSRGYPVYHADASSAQTLMDLGVDRAESIIVTIPNQFTLKKLVKTIREINSHIPIVARSEDMRYAQDLEEVGVDILFPETYETGLQLGGAVLKEVGISEHEIMRIKAQFRAGKYIVAKSIDEEPE